jgi:hypothetical protein
VAARRLDRETSCHLQDEAQTGLEYGYGCLGACVEALSEGWCCGLLWAQEDGLIRRGSGGGGTAATRPKALEASSDGSGGGGVGGALQTGIQDAAVKVGGLPDYQLLYMQSWHPRRGPAGRGRARRCSARRQRAASCRSPVRALPSAPGCLQFLASHPRISSGCTCSSGNLTKPFPAPSSTSAAGRHRQAGLHGLPRQAGRPVGQREATAEPQDQRQHTILPGWGGQGAGWAMLLLMWVGL